MDVGLQATATEAIVEDCPVPVRVMLCGEPAALSVMVTAAVFAPVDAGSKLTSIAHFAPAANVVPQVVVILKNDALTPVSLMLEMARAPVPPFVRVAGWEALLVLMGWLPNAIVFVESVAPGRLMVKVAVPTGDVE
jgi:hypothetical protein